jgi:hypothetical protein
MLSLTTDNSTNVVGQINNFGTGSKIGSNTAVEVSIQDFIS